MMVTLGLVGRYVKGNVVAPVILPPDPLHWPPEP
jgi:hypothetical protein